MQYRHVNLGEEKQRSVTAEQAFARAWVDEEKRGKDCLWALRQAIFEAGRTHGNATKNTGILRSSEQKYSKPLDRFSYRSVRFFQHHEGPSAHSNAPSLPKLV